MTERDPFTQFTGAFDRPVAPAPEFAARLRAQILAELSTSQRMDIAATREVPNSGGTEERAMSEVSTYPANANGSGQRSYRHQTTPIEYPQPVSPERPSSRLLRWLPALEVAAAMLLLMTLFGQIIGPENVRDAVVPNLFELKRRPESPMTDATIGALPPSSLSGRAPAEGLLVATPPSDATPAGSPVTSDGLALERSTLAGGSWTFDAAVPTTAPRASEVFPASEEGTTSFSADVEGDTLVRLVGKSPFDYGDLSVEAISLATGGRLWIVPFDNPSIPFIADGRVLVNDGGMPQSGSVPVPSISALDEILWRVPFTGQAGDYLLYPIVVGSILYVADSLGMIQALDVESGQTRWQAPSGIERTLSAGGTPLVDQQSVPVADDQHIYILTADGTFRARPRNG